MPAAHLVATGVPDPGPLLPDVPAVVLLIAALVLVTLSAVLAAAESALHRVARSGVRRLAGHPAVERVTRLLDRRELALQGVSGARTAADMTAAAALTLAAAGVLHDWWAVALAAVGAGAVLLAVVWAVGPRRRGRRRPARVLARVSRPATAATAVAAALSTVAGVLVPRRERSEEDAAQESADELRRMVDRVSESEQLAEKERELLQSVFQLGRTYVREVMVPRTDMVAVRAEDSLPAGLDAFRSGFSRLPVYGETLDDVRGVLYLKDVVRRTHRRTDTADLTVADVLREPMFVPETKAVDELLRQMQARSVHVAVVVDEYGGTAGLVTIEDLLEELVGEMVDEHDRQEVVAVDLGDGSWRVPARTPLGDLGEIFGLDLGDDDVDTVGGLLAKALGKVPVVGSSVEVEGLHLRAERVEGRRRRVATIIAARAETEEP